MKKHYHAIALTLGAALALPASAATLINLDTSGTANVKTTVDQTVNGTTYHTTQTSGNTSGQGVSGTASQNAGVNAGVNVGTSGSSGTSNVSTDVNTSVTPTDQSGATSNGSSVSGTTSGNAQVFSREDFDNSDQGSLTTTMSAADVSSSNDLRSFAVSSMQADENINSVSFADNNVTVSYKDQGRFIGIIPVSITSNVTAQADGTIAVSYPWYSFLVTKDRASLQSDLDANVGAMIKSEGQGSWSARQMAQVASRLSAALKAHFDGTSMPIMDSGTTNASGSVSASSTSAASSQ